MYERSSMANTTLTDRTSKTVRISIPIDLHTRLRHLALDLDSTLAAVATDGLLLVLRYHDCGDGLPEPTAPRKAGHQ